MSRDEMNRALNARFVPALRQLGFKGALPHFRRRRDDRQWLDNLYGAHLTKCGRHCLVDLQRKARFDIGDREANR